MVILCHYTTINNSNYIEYATGTLRKKRNIIIFYARCRSLETPARYLIYYFIVLNCNKFLGGKNDGIHRCRSCLSLHMYRWVHDFLILIKSTRALWNFGMWITGVQTITFWSDLMNIFSIGKFLTRSRKNVN